MREERRRTIVGGRSLADLSAAWAATGQRPGSFRTHAAREEEAGVPLITTMQGATGVTATPGVERCSGGDAAAAPLASRPPAPATGEYP